MEQIIHVMRLELWQTTFSHWLNNEVLSTRWWGLVFSLAIIYFIWWKLLDKSRIMEIVLYGSLVSVMAAFTDIVGITIGAWQYNIRLFPVTVAVFPLDFSVIPISLMMVYQYADKWNRYIPSAIVASIFYGIVTSILEVTSIRSNYLWSPYWAFAEGMAYSFIAKSVITGVKKINLSRQKTSELRSYLVVQPALKPIPEPKKKPEENK